MKKTLNNGWALILLTLFVLSILTACGSEPAPEPPAQEQGFKAENKLLTGLLPDKAGYRWFYSGFAEYGHLMELEEITTNSGETSYRIKGTVDDPSGGEAQGDFSLSLDYTVKEGVLRQKKTAPRMMDTFEEMELLRVPLNPQAQWEQKVKDGQGREYSLKCTITEIREDKGVKTYSVLYKDRDSDFYEKRQFRENTGVVLFEKLWINGTDKIEMGYYLNEDASGHPAGENGK